MIKIFETRALGLVISVAVVALLTLQQLLSRRRIPPGQSLPPGPSGKPIIGNLFDLPKQQEWVGFSQLANIYGDLVYLKVFGQSIVVINSAEVAYELFEKRSSIYSDRRELPMTNDLMGWNWNIGFMRYGERWRSQRRAIHKKLNSGVVSEYQPIQLNQIRVLLQRLYQTPGNFVQHLRHTAGAIIMEVVYGIKVLPKDDPYINAAEKALAGISEAGNPGTFLVDTVPILKYVPEWFPGAGFQRKAKIWRQCADEMRTRPFEAVKQSIKSGTAVPSYTSTLLEELSLSGNAHPEREEVIRDTGTALYAAGLDTTVAVLHVFFLAMVLFPDAQRKAQKELDAVVGACRLPEFGDRENLPYVNALCKEVIRWHPAIPLGAAHSVTQDDVFGDYFIPAGSIIMGNTWYMLHNEAVYGADTDKFLPERFLTSGTKEPTVAFGFGRRFCAGRRFADNSIYMAIASILSVFEITPSRDHNEKDIAVNAAFKSGFFSGPMPFQCAITPRSETASRLIFPDSSSEDYPQ